ncbi:(deoxy)nucleoside triphosphate pyrophosphohydrolase [Microbacterium murale]|uniref:8-oxo-dGTP diphosphatase n=1 Tax=Microbacterium murale TaxID=1081040 RepID=A0ABU0P8X7_9MICO|nr:(deoxy)nucleoside triphosphate pyrophosphohydrolase [Microbacterium murale]MDQ0643770.1 8-oxo-dGTP diphosphatase [Microbacterium murale]
MKKQINVVGAVLIRDGAALAAQRSRTMSLPGLWEFPGGKVEFGETPQDALAREIQEELLCTVSVGERVEATTHEYEFGVVTLTTYYATIVDGDPRLTEHADLRWIPLTDLYSVDWAPADIPTVDRILGGLA